MGLVPIYTYEDGDKLPEKGNYFVVAKNGIFLHKDAGIVKGLVKAAIDDLPLGKLDTEVSLELPPLPKEITFKALTFFRRVFYQHNSESATVLFYNTTTKEYYLHCPRQRVSHGGVNYGVANGSEDPEELDYIIAMRKKGFRQVGTIHSHCDFSAFHSGTDTNDEARFDGIHITIGHVNKKYPSLVSSLVVYDNRFQVDPATAMEGIYQVNKSSHDYRFGFDMTQEEKEEQIGLIQEEIEEEWMPRVTKVTFAYNKQKDYGSFKNWTGAGTYAGEGFQSHTLSQVDAGDEQYALKTPVEPKVEVPLFGELQQVVVSEDELFPEIEPATAEPVVSEDELFPEIEPATAEPVVAEEKGNMANEQVEGEGGGLRGSGSDGAEGAAPVVSSPEEVRGTAVDTN